MEKEFWIEYNGKFIKNPSKWIRFKRKIKFLLRRWKIIDTHKCWIIPENEKVLYFKLSEKEYREAERMHKEEHRTISYEFYPCGGIGWGVRIRDLDTKEVFDITSYENW